MSAMEGSPMRILITGNMGYVGPVVVKHLRQRFPSAELVGYDNALFAHCLTAPGPLPEAMLNAQHFGDTRDIPVEALHGVDAIVHLAAISNDPMGNRFEDATDQINRGATLRLAALASRAGVKRFVFASSCSVYGYAEGAARREGDALAPLTAYARSKIASEEGLAQADLGDMGVTCLRFATACGMSPRLRLDLVLNDFVAGALTSGEISVLSDGTPWRPLIHVEDMARAIDWAVTRDLSQGGRFLVVNAGSDQWNYQVASLAGAVAERLPGTRVSINENAPPDRRSYRVDFSLFSQLAPRHQPKIDLASAIDGLVRGLEAVKFADTEFRTSQQMRLRVLAEHIETHRLSPDLRWTPPSHA